MFAYGSRSGQIQIAHFSSSSSSSHHVSVRSMFLCHRLKGQFMCVFLCIKNNIILSNFCVAEASIWASASSSQQQ